MQQVFKGADKVFEESYFEENNFIKKTYSYLSDDHSGIYDNVIHICFNLDCKYFHQLGVTVTSVLENNPQFRFVFHVFIDSIADADVAKVQQVIEKYKCDFHIYIMQMEPFSHFHLRNKRYSHVGYFRVYMPKILRKFTKKYLYIDADMICVNSLQPFLDIDLQGKPIACVSDFPDALEARAAFLKLKSGKYFNAGMMWVDVEEWEKQKITEHCFEYIDMDPNCFTAHDQDVLNLVFDGNYVLLPKIFNYMGGIGVKIQKDIIIYHFFGRIKPWDVCLTDYDKVWRKYCKISFWDTIEDPLPPRESKYYADFKFAGEYYQKQGDYLQAFKCYLIYSVLKIKLKLSLEKS